jgi:tetratricopeptide (TPR) repeat protein
MLAFGVGKRQRNAPARLGNAAGQGVPQERTIMARSRRGLLLPAAAGLFFAAVVSSFAAGDREDCASADNPDQKIASCTRAIADDAASAADRADAYNRRGVLYYAKNDYDGAIADYSEAIKLDPISAEAYKNRGNAYYNRKDYDRAIADYNEVIRLDPNHALPSHAPAYLDRGLAYFNKKDYDRAIGDYSEAIRLLVDRELGAVQDDGCSPPAHVGAARFGGDLILRSTLMEE